MVKMVIRAVMEWHNMATNIAVIGVYGKSRINAISPRKWIYNNCNGSKVMAKSKEAVALGHLW